MSLTRMGILPTVAGATFPCHTVAGLPELDQ
jgi:hypothetical protein